MSIRITELDAINSLQDGDYVAVDNESTGTHKFKALDISANLAGNIANTYSSSASYAIGQYCLYNNNLYRCTTTISTPEAWNGAHWVQVTVGEGLYDKVDKVSGKALSANDFTNAYKTKLDGIEAGAEVNVQSNWTESDNTKDDYIKNKPGNATQSTSGFMSATDKAKLDSIASGAEVNVQANWTENDSSKDDYIKNKPIIDEALNLSSHNAVRNSAITAGINQVQGNLNTEITNRQNAVSGEQLARENADNALDGRLDIVEETLPNKANIDGSYDSMTVGNAEQLVSNIRINDKIPYLFRTSGGSADVGDREYINAIVGGTVAWNQLGSMRGSAVTSNNVIFTPSTDKLTTSGIAIGGNASCPSFGNNPNPPIIKDHIYLILGCPRDGNTTTKYSLVASNFDVTGNATDTGVGKVFKGLSDGVTNLVAIVYDGFDSTGLVFRPQLFDLTQMFGSTIANYIFALDQANIGAGATFFKKLGFDKPYYAYNAGELKSVSGLISHDMTGFNQLDINECYASSFFSINGETLTNIQTDTRPSPQWMVQFLKDNSVVSVPYLYDYTSGNRVIVVFTVSPSINADTLRLKHNGSTKDLPIFNMPFSGIVKGATYCLSLTLNNGNPTVAGGFVISDICLNIAWDGSRNGEYEPYVKYSYPLDNTLTLRGIPKLDANNNLYYDGDVYEADGTVARKYGIVDLGTLNGWQKITTTDDHWRFYTTFNSAKADGSIISNRYPRVGAYEQYLGAQGVATQDNGGVTVVMVADENYADVTTFESTMNGVYLVYELATPTTETADPYQQVQIVNNFGTEEYVISDNIFAVPVGTDTDYPVNLVAKLEMAPNSPSGDGDYIVRQTDGMNSYVPLVIEDALPTIPSTVGTYKLIVTVASGSDPVLSWEAE